MESPLLQEEVEEEEDVSQPKLNRQSSVQDEPPYSVRNELTYFFKKGLPLGLSATLEWGVPPLVAMVFAGHVEENSDELQTALGFGRVFYNCTVLMILIGLMNYHYSGVPGLVGANRRERLPVYTFRSIVLTTICLLPMFCLQFFSGDIMHVCGIERHIADEITTYTSYMIISSILLMLEAHIENVFINLGYTKSAAFNSFLTGLGVDVVSTYLLIFRMNLGTKGAAFAQIVVKSARILVWIGLGVRFRLGKYFFGKSNEKVFDRDEVKEYFALGIPRILTFFTGWLVFELQIMALANIKGITSAQKAAGAIWVQLEGTLAAIQNGWLKVTSMRSLVLLAKRGDQIDPEGAKKGYAFMSLLSFGTVLLTNIPLLIFNDLIAKSISNNTDVQDAFKKIVWLLAIQSQTRVLSINSTTLLTPIDFGRFAVLFNVISFYLIASPLCGLISLTDLITHSVQVKIDFCLSTTNIANVIGAAFGITFMYRLDWDKAARIVRERALLDEKKEKLLRDEDDEENNSEDDDDDAESKSSSPMIIPPILSDAASSNFSTSVPKSPASFR